MISTPMWEVRLFMAGDINLAKRIVAKFVTHHGLCVTISPTTYVYSGGQEEGFVISSIAYAKFCEKQERSINLMRLLGEILLQDLGQASYSICTPTESEWFSRSVPTKLGNVDHE